MKCAAGAARTRRGGRRAAFLGASTLVLAVVLGCAHGRPAEVYDYRPAAESQPGALPADADVQVIDMSRDPAERYEFVRGRLPPNEVIGRFRAIHREGATIGPLLPTLKDFARKRGADVVILSCGEQQVDGKSALVCAGMIVRTGEAPQE